MNSSTIHHLASLAFFLGFSAPAPLAAQSAVPDRMTYQAYVTDDANSALAKDAPANFEVEFRIYGSPTGTDVVWAETQTVTIYQGNFSVLLGNGRESEIKPKPALEAVFNEPMRYIGITVGDNEEFSPRQRILPNAFAYRAKVAEQVGWAQPKEGAAFGPVLTVDGSNVTLAEGFGFTAMSGSTIKGNLTVHDFNVPLDPDKPEEGDLFDLNPSGSSVIVGGLLHVLRPDAETATFYATGKAQGNGMFFAGQSSRTGGGFSYNGDSRDPDLEGETDRVSYFRRLNDVDSVVFSYSISDSDVDFNGGASFSGDVGIGTDSPSANLHVSRPDDEVATFYATGTGQGNGMFYAGQSETYGGGFFYNGNNENPGLRDVSDKDRVSFFRRNNKNDVEVFSFGHDSSDVEFTGKVGIGTSTPAQKLDVVGGAAISGNLGIGTTAPKVPLHAYGDADAGLADGTGLFMVGKESGTNLIMDDNELMARDDGSATTLTLNHEGGDVNVGNSTSIIALKGKVGIGTTKPSKGLLEVVGTGSMQKKSGVHYTGVQATGETNVDDKSLKYSIYAESNVGAASFFAFSDSRTKTIVGQSNGRADLRALLDIEITDYSMVDTIARGGKSHKKVIAQQVQEIYPQAVTISRDVVPDIYQKGTVRDGFVRIEGLETLKPALKAGDRVRFIKGEDDRIHDVLEVDESGFRIEEEMDGEVFVYGREVDDFHSVDYDAISMLNVSATQAVHAELQTVKSENTELRKRLAVLEARDRARDAKVASLEVQNEVRDAKLAAIEKMLRGERDSTPHRVALSNSTAAGVE